MASWEEWVQGVSGTLLGAYVQDRQYARQAETELAKMQLQALGSTGAYYNEGKPGASELHTRQGLVISPGLLLVGGLLLFFAMKD